MTFRGVNGDLWVESLLTSLSGGQVGFLIVVNAMVFVLAFFLDYFELAFIVKGQRSCRARLRRWSSSMPK